MVPGARRRFWASESDDPRSHFFFRKISSDFVGARIVRIWGLHQSDLLHRKMLVAAVLLCCMLWDSTASAVYDWKFLQHYPKHILANKLGAGQTIDIDGKLTEAEIKKLSQGSTTLQSAG